MNIKLIDIIIIVILLYVAYSCFFNTNIENMSVGAKRRRWRKKSRALARFKKSPKRRRSRRSRTKKKPPPLPTNKMKSQTARRRRARRSGKQKLGRARSKMRARRSGKQKLGRARSKLRNTSSNLQDLRDLRDQGDDVDFVDEGIGEGAGNSRDVNFRDADLPELPPELPPEIYEDLPPPRQRGKFERFKDWSADTAGTIGTKGAELWDQHGDMAIGLAMENQDQIMNYGQMGWDAISGGGGGGGGGGDADPKPESKPDPPPSPPSLSTEDELKNLKESIEDEKMHKKYREDKEKAIKSAIDKEHAKNTNEFSEKLEKALQKEKDNWNELETEYKKEQRKLEAEVSELQQTVESMMDDD